MNAAPVTSLYISVDGTPVGVLHLEEPKDRKDSPKLQKGSAKNFRVKARRLEVDRRTVNVIILKILIQFIREDAYFAGFNFAGKRWYYAETGHADKKMLKIA